MVEKDSYSRRNGFSYPAKLGLAALAAAGIQYTSGCVTMRNSSAYQKTEDIVISQKDPYIVYGNGKFFPNWGVKRGGDSWYVNAGKMAFHALLIWGGSEVYKEIRDSDSSGRSSQQTSAQQQGGSGRGNTNPDGTKPEAEPGPHIIPEEPAPE